MLWSGLTAVGLCVSQHRLAVGTDTAGQLRENVYEETIGGVMANLLILSR